MGILKALDKNLDLTDKRIIVRVDLNVPMQEEKITDKSRILKIIPIIKELTKRKAKVILISHLGRPKGKIDQKLSLKPLAPILESLLNSKVNFSNEKYGSATIEKSKKIKSGEVILFENIRFNKEEELNTESFAKTLSNTPCNRRTLGSLRSRVPRRGSKRNSASPYSVTASRSFGYASATIRMASA